MVGKRRQLTGLVFRRYLILYGTVATMMGKKVVRKRKGRSARTVPSKKTRRGINEEKETGVATAETPVDTGALSGESRYMPADDECVRDGLTNPPSDSLY